MFMRVAATVFLFLTWLRFLESKSVSQIIRSRFSDLTIKRLRKIEQIDYCLRRAELDLVFFSRCRASNVISRFLNFCLAVAYNLGKLGYFAPWDISELSGIRKFWLKKIRQGKLSQLNKIVNCNI